MCIVSLREINAKLPKDRQFLKHNLSFSNCLDADDQNSSETETEDQIRSKAASENADQAQGDVSIDEAEASDGSVSGTGSDHRDNASDEDGRGGSDVATLTLRNDD